MREWPESRRLLDLVERVTRLRRAQTLTQGAAMGLLVAAAVATGMLLSGAQVATTLIVTGLVTIAGIAQALWRCDATPAASAAAVESRAPECRNVIVTAVALLADPKHTPPQVCRVVLHDGVRIADQLDIHRLFPWSPVLTRTAGAALVCATAFLVRVPAVERLLPTLTTEASTTPLVSDVRVTVTPPSYTGLPAESSVNPDRIVALAGSRVTLRIAGSAEVMTVETALTSLTAARGSDGAFEAGVDITADGFVAITPSDGQGTAGLRRLIGVTATPDRPPVPRIVTPGKDLFLREAKTTLPLTVEATDDLGLRALTLAYTKVAGVGESFTFTEGEVPLSVTRTSGRQWAGTGTLPLASLGLEVGDMIVYRAVAADGRPGARPVESDAFIVEIVSASEAMAEGFSIDDTQDKYALSQQMVIVKTERLIAKAASRQSPGAEAILEEAMAIAAEQRSVRAELVFMMGGHFEDEFVEAEHEHEIAEGRMDNSGRADLGRAIRDMSRAASELTDGNLKPALEAEKAALEAMQRALSRRRFILRTLTQRESIDDSRRLTGALTEAARARRTVAEAAVPAHIAAVRDGLAVLAREDSAAIASVIERLLPVSAADPAIVDIVAVLSKANEALAAGRAREARQAIENAAARMTTLLRTAAPASEGVQTGEMRRLKGALTDAQKRGGGR